MASQPRPSRRAKQKTAPRSEKKQLRGKKQLRTQKQRNHKAERKALRPSGPRPLWSGNITFGLVSLPVNLYPANRSKPVSLTMVDHDGTPLKRRYFCELEQCVLDYDELIRGYEVEKGEFVVVTDEELESLDPERSQEIDLQRFVALEDIDPIYFERAYLMTPDKGITKAYRLLAESMEKSGRAGVATFVMRGKEYVVAIIAEKGILRAETLRFADEVRSLEEIGLPERRAPEKRRVKEMEKAIAALSRKGFERELLQDPLSRRIVERAGEKLARGDDVVTLTEESGRHEVVAEQGGEVIDLMQVIKQSLAEGRPPMQPPEGGGHPAGETGGKKKSDKKKTGNGSDQSDRAEARRAKLEKLSRDELYRRAQKLDVPGRSGMNKAELVDAIAARC